MKTSKLARYGLLVALALVLSYAESLVPPIGVPGVKLGLPNLVVIFALYRLGTRDAWVLSLVRVLLVSMLFGTGVSLAYSLAGAVLSLAVMCLLKRTGKFSETGVSVAGGRGPQRGSDPGGHGPAGDLPAGLLPARAVRVRDGGRGAHRPGLRPADPAGAGYQIEMKY